MEPHRSDSRLLTLGIPAAFFDEALEPVLFTREAEILFGLRNDEGAGTLAELSRQLDYPELEVDARAVLSGCEPSDRQAKASATGRWYHVQIRAGATDSEKCRGIAIAFIDITECKLMESEATTARLYAESIVENLRESEARLRAILDTSPDPIFLKDRESRLVLANPATFKIIGKKADECLGKTDEEYYEDAEAGRMIIANDRRVIEIGCTEVIEEKIPGPGGWLTFLSTKAPFRAAGGEIVGTVGVARDITERKQAEEELRKSEQKYRDLFENMSEAFELIEPLYDPSGKVFDFRFIEVNHAAEAAFRRSAEELVGKRAGELSLVIEEYWLEMFGRVMATGEPAILEEYCAELANYYHARAWRVGGDQIAIISSDVSERVQTEQALRQARSELERRVEERTAELNQKRARLQHLARDLAAAEHRERKRLASLLHDGLQQDLVVVQMQLDLLRNDPGEGWWETLQACDELLEQALESSRDLTRELRPPVLYESGLVAALFWLAEDMGRRHRLVVDVEAPESPTPVQEDVRAMLFEAVRELLFNVVKHADVREAAVRYEEAGGVLRVTVSDRGHGIDLEAAKRKDHGGKGLGLFSIGERLETFEGSLEIESVPERGARIALSIPLAFVAQQPNELEVAVRPEKPGDRVKPESFEIARVLVVDDHPIVRQGLVNLIARDSRLEVVGEVGDGLAAIEYLEKHPADVALIDVNMPRVNGVEATRRIHERWPHINVIGLSVQDDPSTHEAMIAAGAVNFLSKNTRAEELVRTVLGAGV